MPRLDYMAGIFDDDDRLLACGGLDGSTIKGLAVCAEARHLNLAAKIVTHLRAYALEEGCRDVTVFTRPQNIPLFRSMGFCLIGQSEGAALLETDRLALDRYLGHLRSLRPEEGTCGVIVMNANPLTKGHLYLIDQASRRCDRLVVIPVAYNPLTLFSYKERRAMLAEAVAQLPNVVLAEASLYTV